MVLSARLELRQSQSLVMTPQLQQAIKLLQLSNFELMAYVEAELERNPILDRAERDEADTGGDSPVGSDGDDRTDGQSGDDLANEWLDLTAKKTDPAAELDTEYDNVDPEAGPGDILPAIDGGWSSIGQGNGSGGAAGSGDYNLEGFVAREPSLHDHLLEQLSLVISDPVRRMIARHLISMVDEAGYVRGDIEPLAEQLGAPLELVLDTLKTLQTLDPAGVCARNLGECLAIQLRERNRYDPMIAAVIDNLGALARHDFRTLRRVSGADKDELGEIIGEIKSLNPKPGLKFGSVTVQPVVPDVVVRERADGTWLIELNSETLPRVLVDRSYYAVVSQHTRTDKDKEYLHGCLQSANWLVKSLDQRARTILKVAEEIVRQQDMFLSHGVQHLRPLNLKAIADAISMHESTVSRVTSNKYMATPRGIFELKYFFTSAIASSGNGEAHSSESVRHRIKQLVDAETASNVLSDDKLVALLEAEGIEIARRTVAKYREALHIPSSIQRRRDKKLAGRIEKALH